jgi:hypothetical protein
MIGGEAVVQPLLRPSIIRGQVLPRTIRADNAIITALFLNREAIDRYVPLTGAWERKSHHSHVYAARHEGGGCLVSTYLPFR